MAKKSVFDESALDDDLDEFLPRVGVGNRTGRPDSAATPVAPASPPTETPAPELKADASPQGGGVGAAGSRALKVGDSDGEGNPTAEISAENLARLRNLNLAEKKKNPAKARTYGQIVLDAIDAVHEELARHWKPAENPEKAPGSLFTRQPVVRKRRRHIAPPAKIALTGLNPADAKTIDDQLVKEWGAPSRSALVDEALTLYFKRRRGPARTTKTSVDTAAS
ncbi:hypothetical protein [Mycobacterium intracellulare]|jgi:hypothetical protein|uniref:hypothetical protein n=1 Tax=Mycobacterium intracellulare TaxID=1767 RepID=UPI000BAC26F5|nr:hypothetical protein [Mycobacterium intracellulare]ASX03523.1 hypothetical protein CKJ58_26225 [Mycobacterium intracellulare subsp. chimaera]PBA61306.1 hypothetical protein CKJ56_13195 [Mycobacterium intracellulare subsp. chimaera]